MEREHPLEMLVDSARRAVAGHGGVVLVAGEAGIGKTVLLREFGRCAPTPLLLGMCDPLSTPRPLGPLHDVADELGPAVTAVLRGAAAQHEIFHVVLDTLRERPRVLVVEDVHWGDEATLDLVRFLARRIARLPLLLVLSYRDDVGPGHPLRPVLGDLVSSPDTRRMQLVPLSRGAVAALLDGLPLDPAEVHRRTGGNPFFVSQILAQPDSPLPESVRDAVIARTAALAPSARRMLELLSCAPEAVTGELLAALAIPTETVEALAATGLVDRHRRGVAFRHEIARRAVLDAVAPGGEPGLHTTMIEALERIDGEASVLAHHAAAVPDVARILRYAPAAAAQSARSGSHREAAAFLQLALTHVGADTAMRAGLLEAQSVELYLTDRLTEAIAAREEALGLRRVLRDTVAVGEAHTAISGFGWYAADRAIADRHDLAAIEILSPGDDPRALGFALANHAYLAAQRGDLAEALHAGDRALRIADGLEAGQVLAATASTAIAVVHLIEGDLSARADLRAASDVGLRLGDDDVATTAMSNLCHLDVEQGRFAETEETLLDALRMSEERDTPICSMWQRGVRARLRLLQGRWREAEADAQGVLAAGGFRLGLLWPHLVLGLLAARRAAPVPNQHLDELWRVVTTLDLPGALTIAVAALAEDSWITRRADPRLDTPQVAALLDPAREGRSADNLRRWAHRVAAAGLPPIGGVAAPAAPPDLDPTCGYERALAAWDAGSTAGLLEALPLLDDLDARAVAALFRARLRDAGVAAVPRGSSPATRANPAGLTTRQLEVLGLLAEGLTNADIADRLVISLRTTDHHVSAILAKLAVRTRGEAAAAARRLGLAAAGDTNGTAPIPARR
jgi:DNA-binding CsgD family transcriptional regulator/tetratricopeptide (TPR) repeat protein